MSEELVNLDPEKLREALQQELKEEEAPEEEGKARAPQVPGEVSISDLLARIRSASGWRQTAKTATRRLLVALLSVLRGYLEQQQVAMARLIEENERLLQRISELEEEMKLVKESQKEFLELARRAKEILYEIERRDAARA